MQQYRMQNTYHLDLIEYNKSYSITHLITKTYDIYGYFEVEANIITKSKNLRSFIGLKCSINHLITGYIIQAHNISSDKELISIKIESSLNKVSRKLIGHKLFDNSDVGAALQFLTNDSFKIQSLVHHKESFFIAKGYINQIMTRLLSYYKCNYIYYAFEEKIVIFNNFEQLRKHTYKSAINLDYDFYSYSSNQKSYYLIEDLGCKIKVFTRYTNIRPGDFITLDNQVLYFVESIYINNFYLELSLIEEIKSILNKPINVSTVSIVKTSDINSTTSVYKEKGVKIHMSSPGNSNNWGTHIRLKSSQRLIAISSNLVTNSLFSPGALYTHNNKHNSYVMHLKRKTSYLKLKENEIILSNTKYQFQICKKQIQMHGSEGELKVDAREKYILAGKFSESVKKYKVYAKKTSIFSKKNTLNTNTATYSINKLKLAKINKQTELSLKHIQFESNMSQVNINRLRANTDIINISYSVFFVKSNAKLLTTAFSSIKLENKTISLNSKYIAISAPLIVCSCPPPKFKI